MLPSQTIFLFFIASICIRGVLKLTINPQAYRNRLVLVTGVNVNVVTGTIWTNEYHRPEYDGKTPQARLPGALVASLTVLGQTDIYAKDKYLTHFGHAFGILENRT